MMARDGWHITRDASVLTLTRSDGGLDVLAGGAVAAPVTSAMRSALVEMLEDSSLRQRWMRCARKHP